MNIKKIIQVIVLLIFLTTATGCEKKETIEENVSVEDEKIQIGYSMDSFLIERWQRDRDIFVAKAQELGAEVNVQNANGVLQEQIAQIEYFIEQKVDVLVIVAVDCAKLAPVVEKAKKAGIKVISYDRLIGNANVDLYISFDNYKVGQLMGEAMISKLNRDDQILMINGPLTDNNVPEVINGFYRTITPRGLTVKEVCYADGWRAEDGFDYTNTYLDNKENSIPAGIMCGNDSIAGQVIKALSERRLASKVIVTGQDADLDACQRIVEGTQYMTVFKPVEILARHAAELAVKMGAGEEIVFEETINDGTYNVPYEKMEPIAVTKENMDDVIIGVYHQREEVYLNVKEDTE